MEVMFWLICWYCVFVLVDNGPAWRRCLDCSARPGRFLQKWDCFSFGVAGFIDLALALSREKWTPL